MRAPVAAGKYSLAATLLGLLLILAACGDNGLQTPSAGSNQGLATATTDPGQAGLAPEPGIAGAGAQLTIELPPEPTSAPTPAGLDEQAQSTIYSLVARDLLAQSESSGGGSTAFVGISPSAGQGELLDTSASGVPIPNTLVSELADLGLTVSFTPFNEAIGDLEDGGRVRENGVYLTFSPLRADLVGGGYQIYASYYHAIDDAAGYSYIMLHEGNAWNIKDRKEVWRR